MCAVLTLSTLEHAFDDSNQTELVLISLRLTFVCNKTEFLVGGAHFFTGGNQLS